MQSPSGSLVKYIICQVGLFVKCENRPVLSEIHERVLGKNLTSEEQNNYTETLFESIKHINEYGEEFWYARELSKVFKSTPFFLILGMKKPRK